jgi:branched-chain amino acid transport system substrate-binding protein
MYRSSRLGFVVVLVAAIALIGAACSESTESGASGPSTTEPGTTESSASATSETGTADTADTDEADRLARTMEFFGEYADQLGEVPPMTDPDADTIVGRWAGQPWFVGELPETPVAAEGEPIKIGMINQENEIFGDFPELRQAALAAVEWVNNELGGVGGRPLELLPCNTNFSPEEARQCALDHVRAGVVAVTAGINIQSETAMAVYEENGIPLLGGIPVNDIDMTSEIAHQWSGGTAGMFSAWSSFAVEELGAEKIVMAVAEFAPNIEAAERFGRTVAESLGAEVELITFPLTETDYAPTMNKVADLDPDAVFIAAVDTGCIASIQAANAVGLDIPRFFSGACASPDIEEQLGEDIHGAIFAIESIIETDEPEIDRSLYFDVVSTYGEEGMELIGAGTVSVKSIMNIWDLMNELGPDDVTPDTLIELVGQSQDRASFMGHPYTCDGQQLPDLPAVCSPQQVLVQNVEGDLAQVSDGWIDVSALFQ